jgi:hypothetical protein
VSIDAAESALSAAGVDAGVVVIAHTLSSLLSSTPSSGGEGVVGGDQRLSDSLHGVPPQSARDVELEAAVSASSTASTALLHSTSPSSPSSPRHADITAVDSAATTLPLHSPPSPGPRRETGVTVLPHASDSCPLDTGAANAAKGIGQLPPTQTTCSQRQAAAGEEGQEEETVAASSPSSASAASSPPAAIPERSWPLPAYITSLPAFNKPDSVVALRSCHIIGGGYCSFAAVLRSRGTLQAQHDDAGSKERISTARKATGIWLRKHWSERQWVDSVPWRVRSSVLSGKRGAAVSSYQATVASLVRGKANDWLTPAFLWPVSAMLRVGVFLLADWTLPGQGAPGVELYHIGAQQAYSEYIVIKWSSSHFASCGVLGADGKLQLCFASGSAVVTALATACVAHAAAADPTFDFGEDVERTRLERSSAGAAALPASLPSPPAAAAAAAAASTSASRLTRSAARAQRARTTHPGAAADAAAATAPPPSAASQRGGRGGRKAASTAAAPSRPAKHKSAPPATAARRRAQSAAPSSAAAAALQAVDAAAQAVDTSARRAQPSPPASLPDLQPTVAQLAAHGVLYDFISFSNVPQWVGMCSSALNAYRVASEKGDSARQTQALIDILMLPQRTLTKLPRGGGSKRAASRLVNTIKARCWNVGAELRRRTGCVDPPDRTAQLTVHTAPLLTTAAPVVLAQRSAAAAAAEAVSPSVAYTDSDAQSDSDSDDSVGGASSCQPASPCAESESESETDDDAEAGDASAVARHPGGPVSDLHRRMLRLSLGSDDKAARLADRLIRAGHTRRAAQTLHSTATMADLTQPAVREAMQLLHPPLPAGSVLPRLPADADQLILEDGEEMKRIIRSSDNGAAAGPSGWTGGLLAALVESDLCRLGIVALLKDILNGNIPDAARPYLLASRLVAITKPDSDSLRPIAVGELFYRLAAVIAVSRTRTAAARLLSPHQHGVGVPSGAERIVHSMQY